MEQQAAMQQKTDALRLAGVVKESIVDGPGFRYTVFVQGCPHHCPGCHNPQTHDFSGGFTAQTDQLLASILKNSLLRGVTFSGGEPFCQAHALAALAHDVHAHGLDVVCYTGYTFEQLLEGGNAENGWLDLLKETDVLIDGPFVLAQRNLLLKFRGSNNQRILDVKKSLASGQAVETEL